jgi:hypothetical protein
MIKYILLVVIVIYVEANEPILMIDGGFKILVYVDE